MADIGSALVTGVATIVGVGAGAGLTYWLGALNRRHQEAREDRTRWLEVRLKAYTEYAETAHEVGVFSQLNVPTLENRDAFIKNLKRSNRVLRLVGSAEVITAANDLIVAATEEADAADGRNEDRVRKALNAFEVAARRDLGT